MKITKTWFTPALLTLALFAGACGKKNESGKSSSNQFGSSYSGVAPLNSSNPYVSQLFQQFPCQTGYGSNSNQRTGVGVSVNIPLPNRPAPNSTHVGVTTLGDIAVLTTDNSGRQVVSLYICPRYNGGAQGPSSLSQPIPGRTLAGCRFDELVLSASIAGYPTPLNFAPVDFIPQLRQNFCNIY